MPIKPLPKPTGPFADEKIISALITMGFPAADSRKAAIATKNVSVDAAL
jgi:uncharacterized UBP type Zn finger protein